MMNMKIFANNMSAMRLEKRWTQEDLAGFLGVSRQAVSKWENGSSLPDIEVLLGISKLFGITINDLLEKPNLYGIDSFEEITSLDPIRVKEVLEAFCPEDLVIATKGSSPEVLRYLEAVFPERELSTAIKDTGPIRVSAVEQVHQAMITRLNQ